MEDSPIELTDENNLALDPIQVEENQLELTQCTQTTKSVRKQLGAWVKKKGAIGWTRQKDNMHPPNLGLQNEAQAKGAVPTEEASLNKEEGLVNSEEKVAPLWSYKSLTNPQNLTIGNAKAQLQRARTSIVSAGIKVGKAGEMAWAASLESSMKVSMFFGFLFLIFLTAALSSRSWRVQIFKYQNANGQNTSTIHLGLANVQRVQKLIRANNAGVIYVYDTPYKYDDMAGSQYCNIDSNPNATDSGGISPKSVAPDYFSIKSLRGPLANPPDFLVQVGRDPSIAGAIRSELRVSRTELLGLTIYDINCTDLADFKKGGALFLNLIIVVYTCAIIGFLIGIFSLFGGITHAKMHMGISILGTISWFLSFMFHLIALITWGAYTDVAACVTESGGSRVCALGTSSIYAILALLFDISALVSYTIYFVHNHIKQLGSSERNTRNQESEIDEHMHDEYAGHIGDVSPSPDVEALDELRKSPQEIN